MLWRLVLPCPLQVAHCYPEHMASFPQQLKELLSHHHTVLDPELRMVRPALGCPCLLCELRACQ